MATTLGFKDLISLPDWQEVATKPSNVHAVDIGFAFDHRNGVDRDPWFYYKNSTPAYIEAYHSRNNEWKSFPTLTIGGAGAGSGVWSIFVPSHGPTGTCGETPTVSSFTLATLPNSASAAPNQFANRGDGVGYKIRIIGKGVASSGKTEERYIVANTSGTTPIVYLDSPLSFIPVATDTYEILSGRVYFLQAGSTAAGFWKAWDIATRTISGNLNVTNLASTIGTATAGVALDEQYVPYDMDAGEGFIVGTGTYDASFQKGCLTATAIAAGTITGQAASGDAAVVANQYRNFQVRVVEDLTNTTAVGQRRKITSHTAGASPVYTLATDWTVTPSATAKFVIEGNNDVLLWTNGATVTYSYAAGGYAADANWSTAAAAGGASQYANPGNALGAGGMSLWAFGVEPGVSLASRNGMIHRFRGGGADTLDILDITGAATGSWSADVACDGVLAGFASGSFIVYDNVTNEGRYAYIHNFSSSLTAANRWIRYDIFSRVFETWAYWPVLNLSASGGGNRGAISLFVDGATKLAYMYYLNEGGLDFYRTALQR